jgi:hypothetical protein
MSLKSELPVVSMLDGVKVDSVPPPTVPEKSELIDAALLNALTSPRERMVLFQLEDSMVRFVQGIELSMAIPPGLNGFHRLLAYRLAQRFGLVHSISDVYGEV